MQYATSRQNSQNLLPKNAGKKWSNEQHIEFITMLIDKKDIDFIAKKLERTTGSIRARLHDQIYKWIEHENKDMNYVIENTPYESIEYIQDIVNSKRQAAKTREKNREAKKPYTKAPKENQQYYFNKGEREKNTAHTQRKKISEDIEQIKNDIKDLKLMMRGMMTILEELTVDED